METHTGSQLSWVVENVVKSTQFDSNRATRILEVDL